MFKFLKKKPKLSGLEKAKELGLITELEFLKIKRERVDEELKSCLAKKNKKRK